MAAIGVGTKYHVALNGYGYLYRGGSYIKKDQRVFAPRFSTGEQGLTDLDLWKTIGQQDLAGGMLQTSFQDPSKVSAYRSIIYNERDNYLYAAPAVTETTSDTDNVYPKFITYKGELYTFAVRTVYVLNQSTKAWAVSKNDFAADVKDMCVIANKLWVSTSGGAAWAYDGSSWAAAGAAVTGVSTLCPFKGKVYASGTPSTNEGKLYNFDPGVNALTAIGDVGDINIRINSMVVYNSRILIGKADGLFAYDGVQITPIYPVIDGTYSTNFQYMAVFNGALYFNIDNMLYRYNGANIEKIAEFKAITALAAGNNRLFIGVMDDDSNGQVLYYDGVGIFSAYYDLGVAGDRSIIQSIGYYKAASYERLFFNQGMAEAYSIKFIDMSSGYGDCIDSSQIETSQYDCGYLNVDKYFDSIELEVDFLLNTDTITVEFRTCSDTGLWSVWRTLGTVTDTAQELNIKDDASLLAYASFKRIQFRFTFNSGSADNMKLRGWSFKYALCPDYRKSWQMTLVTQGTSENPLLLADGETNETKTPAELRNNIYNARAAKYPVGFEDVDFTQLNGALTATATSVTVDSTHAFPSAGYIKLDDEIIKYTAKTATAFTGCTRGVLGTSAASHADNKVTNLYYRVIVTDIQAEAIKVPTTDSYGQESEISVVLQEA